MVISMQIELSPRTAREVKIYWERTQNDEIRALIPIDDITLEEALRRFEETQKPDATSFGMVISAEGEYIGDIWCYCIDKEESSAMLSFLIFDDSMRGKGIGTQAAKLFLKEVFQRYDLAKMGAFSYADNLACISALKKVGFSLLEEFTEEGRDSVYMEISREQFESE